MNFARPLKRITSSADKKLATEDCQKVGTRNSTTTQRTKCKLVSQLIVRNRTPGQPIFLRKSRDGIGKEYEIINWEEYLYIYYKILHKYDLLKIGVTFNGEDLEKLKTTGNCAGCDLRGANLVGAEIDGADLTRADLSYSELVDADLTGANLTEVSLSGADLTGTNFTEANLTEADLSLTRLNGALLIGANLTDADLHGANLFLADLSGANLRLADLTGASLESAKKYLRSNFL